MASNKRRKLESGSSTPPVMSAFAARQQLWGLSSAKKVVEKAAVQTAPEDLITPREKSEIPSTRSLPSRRSKRQSTEEAASTGTQKQEQSGSSTPATPLPESSGTQIRLHSSFKPSKRNLQRKTGGRLILTTADAERLVILGSYGVKVRQGEAAIAGSILTPSDPVQWIHAPLCHALPVLRTADDTVIELQPHPAASGLRQLAGLNPAFARLWNEDAGKGSTTYQIIYTSEDLPKRAALQELVSPAEWNKKLSGLAAARRKTTPVIFLCGPKGSGKSTFGRLLTNRLVTDRGGIKNKPWSSVMVLDLDPGQPEYSPPGVVSLSKITAPNLSPSFCHPTLNTSQGQIRAHAIASVTPALDPAHFIECALDLFSHYQKSSDSGSPLVINTPGWIQGTGLDILSELITVIRPTEVIYTSQDGPEETVSSLQSACASQPPIPFTTLPSQPVDISATSSSPRTPLHLRTMQTMSYFHLSPGNQPNPESESPNWTWDPTPLTDLRPWRVRYGGPNRGFLGVICYDHQPTPDLLAEAVNGMVLGLVKIETRSALRGLCLPSSSSSPSSPSPNKEETQPHAETETEGSIPLILNPQGLTLSPRHSRLLGVVLVRGVDVARQELQLLTPLSEEAVAGLKGEELVLVAGKFDTPSWAYAEGLYLDKAKNGKVDRTIVGGGSGGDEKEDEEGEGEGESTEEGEREEDGGGRRMEVPWVEMLHGSQKRAVGSKVWRVRRDLGRA